jgi:hypothetical protein
LTAAKSVAPVGVRGTQGFLLELLAHLLTEPLSARGLKARGFDLELIQRSPELLLAAACRRRFLRQFFDAPVVLACIGLHSFSPFALSGPARV